MDRSRCTLSVTKLCLFRDFCKQKGWVQVNAKGYFEVLRMQHPNEREPLIVHTKLQTKAGNEPVHYTTWGNSAKLVNQFLKDTK